MSIMLGNRNITDIPSTYTYNWEGSKDFFNIGALSDSENLVFVTHVIKYAEGVQ
jgi:hypothetical protein